MPITEAQARRALWHADIPWDAEVDDSREGAWVIHDHHGLLGGLPAAFSIGCRSLRRAEDFFADLGLEETLFAQVKDLIAKKVVKNDLLALGVVSFDGKGTWSRVDGEKMPGAGQSAYDTEDSSRVGHSTRGSGRMTHLLETGSGAGVPRLDLTRSAGASLPTWSSPRDPAPPASGEAARSRSRTPARGALAFGHLSDYA